MQLMFYSFFIIIIATIINVQSYIYNIFGTKGGKEGRKNKHKYKFVKIKTDLYRQT